MTDEEKKIYEDRHHHQLSDGHEFRLSQSAFVGALIRYCWYFGKRKMNELNHPKERLKNAYLANILLVLLLIGVFGAFYFLS